MTVVWSDRVLYAGITMADDNCCMNAVADTDRKAGLLC